MSRFNSAKSVLCLPIASPRKSYHSRDFILSDREPISSQLPIEIYSSSKPTRRVTKNPMKEITNKLKVKASFPFKSFRQRSASKKTNDKTRKSLPSKLAKTPRKIRVKRNRRAEIKAIKKTVPKNLKKNKKKVQKKLKSKKLCMRKESQSANLIQALIRGYLTRKTFEKDDQSQLGDISCEIRPEHFSQIEELKRQDLIDIHGIVQEYQQSSQFENALKDLVEYRYNNITKLIENIKEPRPESLKVENLAKSEDIKELVNHETLVDVESSLKPQQDSVYYKNKKSEKTYENLGKYDLPKQIDKKKNHQESVKCEYLDIEIPFPSHEDSEKHVDLFSNHDSEDNLHLKIPTEQTFENKQAQIQRNYKIAEDYEENTIAILPARTETSKINDKHIPSIEEKYEKDMKKIEMIKSFCTSNQYLLSPLVLCEDDVLSSDSEDLYADLIPRSPSPLSEVPRTPLEIPSSDLKPYNSQTTVSPNAVNDLTEFLLDEMIEGCFKESFTIEYWTVSEYMAKLYQEMRPIIHEVERNLQIPDEISPLDMLELCQSTGNQHRYLEKPPPVLDVEFYLNVEESLPENIEVIEELQHIHNKLIFDSVNEILELFRAQRTPFPWEKSFTHGKHKPIQIIWVKVKDRLEVLNSFKAGSISYEFNEQLLRKRQNGLTKMLADDAAREDADWLRCSFEETQIQLNISHLVLNELILEITGLLENN